MTQSNSWIFFNSSENNRWKLDEQQLKYYGHYLRNYNAMSIADKNSNLCDIMKQFGTFTDKQNCIVIVQNVFSRDACSN